MKLKSIAPINSSRRLYISKIISYNENKTKIEFA